MDRVCDQLAVLCSNSPFYIDLMHEVLFGKGQEISLF